MKLSLLVTILCLNFSFGSASAQQVCKLNILNDTTIQTGSTLNLSVATKPSLSGSVAYLQTKNEAGFTIPKNEWTYIALTKDNNNVGRVYKNGILVSTGNFTDYLYYWYRLDIGAENYIGYSNWFKGFIDEVRVSKSVRTPQEILNNYSSNSPFSNDANTIGLWHFDEGSDTSISAVKGVAGVTTNGKFSAGKFGNSLYYNGVNSFSQFNMSFPTSNVTLEFWIKPDTLLSSSPIGFYGMYNTSFKLDAKEKQYKYLWSTGDTTDQILVKPAQTTNYWVKRIDSSYTCSDSVTITVLSKECPLKIYPHNPTITAGDSINLVADSSYWKLSKQNKYKWSTGDTSETITVTPLQTTPYILRIQNGTSVCDDTTTVRVIPKLKCHINISPQKTTIVSGEMLHLYLSSTDSTNLNQYRWSTGDTSYFINVYPLKTTTYSVKVTNNYSSCFDTVSITVVPRTECKIQIYPNKTTIIAGETLSLYVDTLSGDTHLWSTGEKYNSIRVAPIKNTNYSLKIINNNFTCSDSVTITVLSKECALKIYPHNPTISAGSSIDLYADSSYWDLSKQNKYEWSTGDTTARITVKPTQTTRFRLRIQNGTSVCNDTTTITVIPELKCQIKIYPEKTTIVAGEILYLSSETLKGNQYRWSTGDTSYSINVSPLKTTTYSVKVTNNNSSCSDSVSIIVVPRTECKIEIYPNKMTIVAGETLSLTTDTLSGDKHLWSTGEKSYLIRVTPQKSTTYSLKTTNNNFTCFDSVTIKVVSKECSLKIYPRNSTINSGNSIELIADSSYWDLSKQNKYEWSTGDTTARITVKPTQTTRFMLRIQNGTSVCNDTTTITVIPELKCQIKIYPEKTTIVAGEILYLSSEILKGNQYRWSTGDTSDEILVKPLQTTIYSLQIKNGSSICIDTVTIRVLPKVNCTLKIYPRNPIIESGSSIILYADSSYWNLQKGNVYLWSTGDTTEKITVAPLQTANYSLQIKNGATTCYDTVTVTVHPVSVFKVISLTAHRINQDITIKWTTENELHITDFIIEKSYDSIWFISYKAIKSKTNQANNEYTFNDTDLLSNDIIYYRLKIISKDGSFSYSSVVKAYVEAVINNFIQIMPNPVSSSVFAIYIQDLPKGNYKIELISLMGQLRTIDVFKHEGSYLLRKIKLPPGLPKGIYQIKISNQYNRFVQKIVVQ